MCARANRRLCRPQRQHNFYDDNLHRTLLERQDRSLKATHSTCVVPKQLLSVVHHCTPCGKEQAAHRKTDSCAHRATRCQHAARGWPRTGQLPASYGDSQQEPPKAADAPAGGSSKTCSSQHESPCQLLGPAGAGSPEVHEVQSAPLSAAAACWGSRPMKTRAGWQIWHLQLPLLSGMHAQLSCAWLASGVAHCHYCSPLLSGAAELRLWCTTAQPLATG